MKKIISILIVAVMLVSSLILLSSCSDKRGADGKDGINGKNGTDGITPTIGENGNWWIGDTDTGVSVQGDKGDKGDTGAVGEDGVKGADGTDGKTVPTPLFRYNDTTKHFEVSLDNGTTWAEIENYNPDL